MIDPTKVVADWEQDYKIMQDQRAEIARLRLTDDERLAINRAVAVADEFHDYRLATTLRKLLERTK
ncbi:MAG: hypothetical protein EBT03_11360 [Betaproteobacteria bacterium]|nr:hypothetical protein [Betaproteobacteria bacterium]NCA17445.1 hypothetical protein [Betaproteobacteria bacterium]